MQCVAKTAEYNKNLTFSFFKELSRRHTFYLKKENSVKFPKKLVDNQLVGHYQKPVTCVSTAFLLGTFAKA